MRKYRLNLNTKKQEYHFDIKDDFFVENKFNNEEFSNVNIKCNIFLSTETGSFFNLKIMINGDLELVCDISNEKFINKVCNNNNFIIKFGLLFSDDDVDVIILESKSQFIDIEKYIYETILFSIPIKREHPMLSDPKKKDEFNKYIVNYNSFERQEEAEGNKENSPFYKSLSKIKID